MSIFYKDKMVSNLQQEIITSVPEEFHLERIDKFISSSLEANFSRTYIQKLIKENRILVNQKSVKANYKIKGNDQIIINLPSIEKQELQGEEIKLEIVYEDQEVLVINKQPGLVIHPSPGNWQGTLVNAILWYYPEIKKVGETGRPGIVHRLDKDTSGLMVVAKTKEAYENLVAQFSAREVKKEYTALVQGKPNKDSFTIKNFLRKHKKYRHKMTVAEEGKEAITEIFLEKVYSTDYGVFSLLKASPKTGRTHQIRVHLSSSGLPIIGDPIYSKKWKKYKTPFLLLASTSLEFLNPFSKEREKFKIDLPDHFFKFVNKLK